MRCLLVAPVLVVASCHQPAPDPTTVTPDEDARLNADAASLDNADTPANATEQP